MAVLTWRNVDAPQGNGPVQGLAIAGGLLSHSADGLANAIGQFGTAQTTLADNAAAQAASRYQTADGLRSVLADGSLVEGLRSLGVDPSRVDAATIGSLQKGVDDRVTQDLHQQQTATSAAEALLHGQKAQTDLYNLGVSQRQQSALDAATPLLNEIALRRAHKDEGGAQALENDPTNRALLRAVDPKTYGELDRGSLDALGKSLSNSSAAFNNNVAVQDRASAQRADTVYQQIIGSGGNNTTGATILANENPQVQALVQQRLAAQKNGWNLVAGPVGESQNGGVTLPSGGGGAEASAGNYTPDTFAATYGPVAEQVAKKTGVDANTLLGQWGLETGWGKSVIPGTNNLGNMKSTGAGVAAKDNATGSVDRYQQFATPEDFGNAYADQLKRNWGDSLGAGADVGKFAAGLRPGQQGGYAQDPNYAAKLTTAANLVSRARSGAPAPSASLAPGEGDVTAASFRPQTDVAGIPARGVDGQTNNAVPSLAALTQAAADDSYISKVGGVGTSSRRAQETSILGVPAKAYQDASNSEIASNNEAIDLLTGARPKESGDPKVNNNPTGIAGALSGKDKSMVGRMLQAIVDSPAGQYIDKDGRIAKPTYGQAALILARGKDVLPSAKHPTFQKWNPTSLSFDDSGQVFDQGAADNLLKSLSSNDVASSAGKQLQLNQADSQVNDAMTAVQAAQAKLKDLTIRMAKGLPVADDAKSQLLGEYNRARDRLQAAQAKQGSAENQPIAVTEARARVQKEIDDRNARMAEDAHMQQLMRDSRQAQLNIVR